MNVVISDNRGQTDFVGMSFSKFKKAHVKKEMLKCLASSKVEQTCYWAGELICAGHYIDLWEIIILFAAKHIHVGNPKLPIYISMRIGTFKELVDNHLGHELSLRNNLQIRELFAEITTILCYSKKTHSFDTVKLKKSEEFSMEVIQTMLKAPNVSYATLVFKPEDPKELFIAANELAYNLTEEGKNSVSACYWMEWIIEFETICKQKKEKFKCERRELANVESKCQMDIVWIIWDIFLTEAKSRSTLVQRIINSALNIFSLRYRTGCHKKRRLLMYFVIEVFTEPYALEEEIVRDKNKIITITKNINKIYKQIKKNEHSPGTDYLYQNLKASNLEKTIAKLETMNNLGAEYIPRID